MVCGRNGQDGAWGVGSGDREQIADYSARNARRANKFRIFFPEMRSSPTNCWFYKKNLRFPIFLFSKIPIYGILLWIFYKIRNLSFKNSGKFAFPPRPSSSSLFMQNPSLFKQYPSQQMILNPLNSKDKFPIFLLDFMHHLSISTGRNVFLLSSFPFHCLSFGPSLH